MNYIYYIYTSVWATKTPDTTGQSIWIHLRDLSLLKLRNLDFCWLAVNFPRKKRNHITILIFGDQSDQFICFNIFKPWRVFCLDRPSVSRTVHHFHHALLGRSRCVGRSEGRAGARPRWGRFFLGGWHRRRWNLSILHYPKGYVSPITYMQYHITSFNIFNIIYSNIFSWWVQKVSWKHDRYPWGSSVPSTPTWMWHHGSVLGKPSFVSSTSTVCSFTPGYPLVHIQKAIENGPVEIVDLPWFTHRNGDFP